MIETERLKIIPLTYQQLIKYVKCDNLLELELNLKQTSRTISAELYEAIENTILPNMADESKNYIYSTIWIAFLKTENKIVGDICFYGEPNENGEIEIGYGTHSGFYNQGFMTEIVRGIIEWAKIHKKVKSIIASTDNTNLASIKVLEKNNFYKMGETDTQLIWRLEIYRNLK